MPKYFAQLNKDKVVERVIVADSLEWCVENLGGEWVETYMEGEKNYAGVWCTYNSDKGNFVAPKPFESWSLNEKDEWVSPIERKVGDVSWNEASQKWSSLDDELDVNK